MLRHIHISAAILSLSITAHVGASNHFVGLRMIERDVNQPESEQRQREATHVLDMPALQPNASNIFLQDASHRRAGVTPVGLATNGSGVVAAASNGIGVPLELLLMPEDCESAISDRDLVTFSGGGTVSDADGIALTELSGTSGNGNMPVSLGANFGNGLGTNPGAVGGGNLGGASGVASGGGSGGGGHGQPGLGDWNAVPTPDDRQPKASPDGADTGGGGAAAVPLPAPLIMAIAGLAVIILARRRLAAGLSHHAAV